MFRLSENRGNCLCKKETENIVVRVNEPNQASAAFKVDFLYPAAPGKTVCVAGSFNDWEPKKSQMLYDSALQGYVLSIELPAGSYEYKFVVDGEWVLDEANDNFAANDFGTLNSCLNVD